MSKLLVTSTGWFGIPGREPRPDEHKVHAVYGGKPVCGTHLPRESEYQWCADGLQRNMIECERCLKMIVRDSYERAGCLDLYYLVKKTYKLTRNLHAGIHDCAAKFEEISVALIKRILDQEEQNHGKRKRA